MTTDVQKQFYNSLPDALRTQVLRGMATALKAIVPHMEVRVDDIPERFEVVDLVTVEYRGGAPSYIEVNELVDLHLTYEVGWYVPGQRYALNLIPVIQGGLRRHYRDHRAAWGLEKEIGHIKWLGDTATTQTRTEEANVCFYSCDVQIWLPDVQDGQG